MILTDDNYYDPGMNLVYTSNSFYKMTLDCEAAAMAYATGKWIRPEFDTFVQGQYGHTLYLEPDKIDDFNLENPKIFQKNGKDLYAIYHKIKHHSVPKLVDHPYIAELYQQARVEQIMTYNFGGTMWRSKLDLMGDGWIGDIKFLSKVGPSENTKGIHPIIYWEYLRQMALYGVGYYKNFGEWPYIHLISVQKSVNPALSWIGMDHSKQHNREKLEAQLEIVLKNLPRMIQVWNKEVEPKSCGKFCDYCKTQMDISKPMPLESIYEEIN